MYPLGIESGMAECLPEQEEMLRRNADGKCAICANAEPDGDRCLIACMRSDIRICQSCRKSIEELEKRLRARAVMRFWLS